MNQYNSLVEFDSLAITLKRGIFTKQQSSQ